MLLFLHGFLGQKEDWDPLFSHFKKEPKLAIDLPGHGFPLAEDMALSIHKQVPQAKYLIGYSAGGRMALELKQRFPDHYGKIILISAHLGGLTEEEKKVRWKIDQDWMEKLKNGSFDKFLQEWYDQPLFSSLKKSPAFLPMLERRKKQDPHQLAQFLNAYSLSKKTPPEAPLNYFYICGKEDLKYVKLYRKLGRLNKIYTIKNAGHAVHLENPKALAEILEEITDEHSQSTGNRANLSVARNEKIPGYQIS